MHQPKCSGLLIRSLCGLLCLFLFCHWKHLAKRHSSNPWLFMRNGARYAQSLSQIIQPKKAAYDPE